MDPLSAHDELMAALSQPRLSAPTAAEAWQTASAAFAAGILAMLLLALVLRLLTRRREAAAARLARALDASRGLDPGRRLLAQARVVDALARRTDAPSRRRRGAAKPALSRLRAEIGAALYAPEPALDLDATERAIRAAMGGAAKGGG